MSVLGHTVNRTSRELKFVAYFTTLFHLHGVRSSNGCMNVNHEKKTVWKKTTVAYFGATD
jgi:hypothetical protein